MRATAITIITVHLTYTSVFSYFSLSLRLVGFTLKCRKKINTYKFIRRLAFSTLLF